VTLIPVTASLAIDEAEIAVSFILGSGPGGQNVNKVATAAQLRFDVRGSPSLPEEVKQRLEALAGRRVTREGIIVMTARRFRSQERNRQDAVERLVALIRDAAEEPTRRRKTKPSRTQRERRLEAKAHRSDLKKSRNLPYE